MDWSSVTLQELADAVKEAEWSSPPRPVSEFFAKFSAPKSFSSWSSRLKCNFYVYRTNYFILTIFILLVGTGIVQSPTAFLGAMLTSLAAACLNDRPGGRGRPSKGNIYICGKDRRLVFIGLLLVSTLLWFLSSTFKIVSIAISLGFIFILLHTSFRTPNLKARLNTFREEFRAVWRSYSDT